MISLKRQLLVAIGSVIVLVSLLSAAISYRSGVIEASELFDAKLAHSARVLMGLVDEALAGDSPTSPAQPLVIDVWKGHNPVEGEAPDHARGHPYETKLAFQVWDDSGHLRLRSSSAPEQALATATAGFSRIRIDGRRWRVFSVRSPHGLWFHSGELNAIRNEVARDIAFGTLLPLLLMLPVLLVMVWLILRIAFRSLERVNQELAQRAVDQLTPIEIEQAPQEIAGTVAAVNRLMARLSQALNHERRFTADAAHELRTPLAALKVHADNLRAAVSREHQRESAGNVQRGIDRLGRLIEQLLAISRLDPAAGTFQLRETELGSVCQGVLEELSLTSLTRRVELEFDRPEQPLVVRADPTLLGLLFRNLVDNALRYTPRGGRVQIRLGRDQDRICFSVEDSGPGIEAAARERVFERFHRELGNIEPGSGLGLAIVRQVAELHGAHIELDQSPLLHGLRASVWFAPVAAAAPGHS